MKRNLKWFAYGDCIAGFKGERGLEVEATRLGNSHVWWITKTIHGVETEHCTYRGDIAGVMEFMEVRYGNRNRYAEGNHRDSEER